MSSNLPVVAQWVPSSLYTSPVLSVNDSNCLSLSIDLNGFFKNNEYFSPVADGQTLPGTSILPALGYQIKRFRAEVGVYGVKYSGRDQVSNVQLFARMQYAITPAFNMVVGNLYGGVNHRLIEPLYQWERQWMDNPESGLQFVLNSKRWFTDVWVNWQKFIKRGDPYPEKLTFGTSASVILTNPDNIKWQISIPVQLVIYHQGGQIDTSDEPLMVIGNTAAGLCVERRFQSKFMKSVGLQFYAANYLDTHPDKSVRPYDKGWGVYPVLLVKAAFCELMAGYWYAEKFYAVEGEPLFDSFNPYMGNTELLPVRHLVTLKGSFGKEVLDGIYIGAQVETYSDMDSGTTDYSFGVNLRFTKRFNLFHIK